MKPALLLVDFQHDYLRAPALRPAAGELVGQAAALLRRCREAAVPVLHVWTTVDSAPDLRMPHLKRAGRWIGRAGTEGHAPPAELRPLASETVLHKTVFSAFADGALHAALRALGVDTVWLAGVQLQSCIRATALDAYQRGLSVCIVSDAVGTENPLHAAMTRLYLEPRAVRFVPAGRLFAPDAAEEAAPADAARAASQAQQAWRAWRLSAPAARAEFLTRLAARVEEAAEALTAQMAADIRKPVRYGADEVRRAVALIRAAARRAPEPLETRCGERSVARRRPRGVIAVITPWNNPVAVPLGRIAPALLYGNAVVWKPAPAAASIADSLMRLIAAAGAPPGVVSVAHGDGATAARLMAAEAVDAVALTGSEAAGWYAQAVCAQRQVPLQAELGGNNAAIVASDADLEAAAAAVAEAAFGFAGQRCTANRRAIVERGCLDDFMKRLGRAVAALHCGEPRDPRTHVGPLISAAKREQVAALVARAGGVVLRAPERDAPDFFPPTVIRCDDPAREIVQEETFGPLLVVQPASDFDHALRLCNGVRQGLVAALFSRSAERQARFLQEAQSGILKLNLATADADAEAPFGGWKASGVGPPEHGDSDRDVYTRPQAVYTAPA